MKAGQKILGIAEEAHRRFRPTIAIALPESMKMRAQDRLVFTGIEVRGTFNLKAE
jgi:hypothetical protein